MQINCLANLASLVCGSSGGTRGFGSTLGKETLQETAEGKKEMERKRGTVSTLHSKLVRKRGLKSSGAESSVRARDQDFSEARDRASISARGIWAGRDNGL